MRIQRNGPRYHCESLLINFSLPNLLFILGIHNFLLYSGILHRIFANRIEVFEQGQGPANTLGGFFGERKLVQLNLTEAGIFREKKKTEKITVFNWNGVPSPIVHQYDRFSDMYFRKSQGVGVLSAFDGIVTSSD
jgi:hypothetical protein